MKHAIKAPSLTVGIEEEYQIIDPETRELQSGIDKIMATEKWKAAQGK